MLYTTQGCHICIIYHTLAYILWSSDLTERNIYSRSIQTGNVTKQWETYEGPDHHADTNNLGNTIRYMQIIRCFVAEVVAMGRCGIT